MNSLARLCLGALILIATLSTGGCTTVPSPPDIVGQDYPGTCMPAELWWPTDFLESLPGESTAVGGIIVGLRLEYVDSEWMWRLRSMDTKYDVFGERVDDRSYGRESLVDVRTLETITTHNVELTDAEQQMQGTSASAAAQLSGEQWPSPLIIELARVTEGDEAVWHITTCNTETNEHSVATVN